MAESFQPIKWKRGKTTQTQKHRDTNTTKQRKGLCGFNALALLGHYVAVNVIIFRAITKHQTSDWQIVSSDHPLEPSRMNLLLRSKLDILECVLKLSLAGAATSIIFVATNTCLSRQICVFPWQNTCLSLQNYVCRDKYFSGQRFCRDKNILSRQKKLATKLLSRQAHVFLPTKVLSRQKYLWPMIQNGVFMTPSCTQSLVPPVLFIPTHYKIRSRRSRQTRSAQSTFGQSLNLMCYLAVSRIRNCLGLV